MSFGHGLPSCCLSGDGASCWASGVVVVVVVEYGDLHLSAVSSRVPSLDRLSLLRLWQAINASATRGDTVFSACRFEFRFKPSSSVTQSLPTFIPPGSSGSPKDPPAGSLRGEPKNKSRLLCWGWGVLNVDSFARAWSINSMGSRPTRTARPFKFSIRILCSIQLTYSGRQGPV